MQSQPLYTLGPFWSSELNKDSQLNIFVSDKHFQIELKASNFEASPTLLAEYLRHLERLEPDYLPHSNEEFEDPLEGLADWALGCFKPIFQKISPLRIDRNYALHDCLFPNVLHYSLCADETRLLPVFLDRVGRERLLGTLLPESQELDYYSFPTYRPDEIQVPVPDGSSALPAVPRKVYIKGQQLAFFKSVNTGDVNSTFRELRAYAKIKTFSQPVNTCKLYGIVQIPSSGRIVGLLLSYIESDNRTLLCAGKDPRYASMRQKWTDQITRTVEELHAHGVVWGDAKPDNVLIDVQDDACLIDFGGGYTRGWVNKELANTTEGDLHGLRRISEWLSGHFPTRSSKSGNGPGKTDLRDIRRNGGEHISPDSPRSTDFLYFSLSRFSSHRILSCKHASFVPSLLYTSPNPDIQTKMPQQLISRNVDPYHNDPSKLYLGYREQDYKKPWAKYFNPNVALISDEVEKGLICSPWASPLGYGPSEAHDRLLRPGYETIENGFVATKEGTTMIAVRTDMGDVTGEMYDWWFSWHLTDTSRYKLWHPQAHQYTWRNPDELDITHKSSYAERYIGIFSFINEYLGSHCTDLTVAFIDPKELGIEKEKWPKMGIETMVCARIGTPGQGHITENFDGKSYLIHQIRRGQDGKRELRSRFWLPAPEGAARDLMVHCGMEMSHLATFLPALFEEFKYTL